MIGQALFMTKSCTKKMCNRVWSSGAANLLDAIVNRKKIRGLDIWWSSSKGCWIVAGHTEYQNNTVRIPGSVRRDDHSGSFSPATETSPPVIRNMVQFLRSQAYPFACPACSVVKIKVLVEVSS